MPKISNKIKETKKLGEYDENNDLYMKTTITIGESDYDWPVQVTQGPDPYFKRKSEYYKMNYPRLIPTIYKSKENPNNL